MNKKIQRQAGFVCSNCGRRFASTMRVELEIPVNVDNDVKAWVFPELVAMACDRCGHRMIPCDPGLIGPISKYVKLHIPTRGSCQGYYRLCEYFDSETDADDDSYGSYTASMEAVDPYMAYNLDMMDRAHARLFALGMCDAIIKWMTDYAELSEKIIPIMSLGLWESTNIDSGMSSNTFDCVRIDEYKDLATMLEGSDFFKRFPEFSLMTFRVCWPADYEEFEVVTLADAITKNFIEILNRGIDAYKDRYQRAGGDLEK